MSKITQTDYQEYLELINQGNSQRTCCTILGLNRSTMQNYLKRVAEKDDEESLELKHITRGELLGTSKIEKQQPLTKSKPTIFVIADTQCKPSESLEYILWVGRYISDKKPDIVIMIGDWWDMPSLSSYDKGKASAEGRRFKDDLEAGNKGMELLNLELSKDPTYQPRKVFCKGNHEHRIDRYVEDNPELQGTIGTEFLPLESYGWEVHDFLHPVEIEDIYFVHYLANPMTGKPYSGTASSILKTVGKSFVVGHKQVLDITIRPTIDGKQQIGIVNGACYPFNEKYKGVFGNVHYRGITVLTEVKDGFGLPSFVSLEHMKEKYYE